MTSLRWDNVPKRRVERPALPTPGSKAGHRKQPSFPDRIEEAGKTRTERQGPFPSASAAASVNDANRRYSRCSTCKARGVTLWQVKGLLVCAICRTANRVATPQSGNRQEQDFQKTARSKRTAAVVIAGKGITCRTRGLTLRDASTPRRKTVRRYDLVDPRWSDLSPENAALLMKVNQQNTLVDMWR
jgi:hypothetical protein